MHRTLTGLERAGLAVSRPDSGRSRATWRLVCQRASSPPAAACPSEVLSLARVSSRGAIPGDGRRR